MDINSQPAPSQFIPVQTSLQNQKSGSSLLIIVCILLLFSLMFNVYFFAQINRYNQSKLTTNDSPTPTGVTTIPTKTNATQDWKTYTNTLHKVSVKYPADWKYYDSNQSFVIFSTQDFKMISGTEQLIPGVLFSILRMNYDESVKMVAGAYDVGTQQEHISVGSFDGVHIFGTGGIGPVEGIVGGAYILKNKDGKAFEFSYNVVDNKNYQVEAKRMMESLVLN